MMRKFIISIIILLFFGGFLFFWGWVSFYLPSNAYAVLHTKTNGIDPQVVSSGTFAWKIERLLPTNMTIYTFNLNPVTIEIPPVTGQLPSGDVYATILDGDINFEFELGMTIQLKIKPSALPKLVEEEGLRPEGLDNWYKSMGDLIVQTGKTFILQNPLFFFNSVNFDEEQIKTYILKDNAFASLDLIHVIVKKINMPDIDLYKETKRRYLGLSQARDSIDIASLSKEKNNIATLHKYGELFSKYPILLKYLYLKELDGEKLDIFDLSIFGEPKVGAKQE